VRSKAFTGSLIGEIIIWVVGAQVVGGVLGYVFAEARNYLSGENRSDVVWVATRAAFASATAVLCVIVIGHAIRAMT
jgi:hypothetical protein